MAGVGGGGEVTIKSEPSALDFGGVHDLVEALDCGDDDNDDDEKDNKNNEEEEEDEILREIEVYLAPELSSTLHLVQFPLQPVHSFSGAAAEWALPETARVRPRHGMLQLDFAVPASALNAGGGPQSQIAQRTYDSYKVPVTTHLALGKLSKDGKRLHVIPLRAVRQMRPSFTHIDEAAAASSGGGEEEEKTKKKAEQEEQSLNATPLGLRRKESERAELARRSSYAYKRASEESEEWIEMEVCASGTPAHVQALEATQCPEPERHLQLLQEARVETKTTQGGGGGSLTVSYVHTLNYLSQGGDLQEDEEAEDNKKDTVVTGDQRMDPDKPLSDADAEKLWVTPQLKTLTRKVAILLKTGAGIPTPFAAVRCRFSTSATDDKMLVRALSACAALVRGNFVIRSNIIGLAPQTAAARDFILTLLNRDGIVFRQGLQEVLTTTNTTGGGSTASSPRISLEVLNEILSMVARPSDNCMELLVQDDWQFEKQFPQESEWHRAYWLRKEEQFQSLLSRYEEYLDKHVGTGPS